MKLEKISLWLRHRIHEAIRMNPDIHEKILALRFDVSITTIERVKRSMAKKHVFPGYCKQDYVRCPECGGMVLMPCLLCHHRSRMNSIEDDADSLSNEYFLALEADLDT